MLERVVKPCWHEEHSPDLLAVVPGEAVWRFKVRVTDLLTKARIRSKVVFSSPAAQVDFDISLDAVLFEDERREVGVAGFGVTDFLDPVLDHHLAKPLELGARLGG